MTLNGHFTLNCFCQLQVQDLRIYLYGQRHCESKAIKYSKVKVTYICVPEVCTKLLHVTSCGAGHNKPRPRAATQRKAKSSNFITFSVARWQHRTARRPQSNRITNYLTFDPPTRLSELTQNLIRSSHGHSTPSLKISCKSVQPFCRNLADKETNKETNKERNRSITIPRPSTGGGVNILTVGIFNSFGLYDQVKWTCFSRRRLTASV